MFHFNNYTLNCYHGISMSGHSFGVTAFVALKKEAVNAPKGEES